MPEAPLTRRALRELRESELREGEPGEAELPQQSDSFGPDAPAAAAPPRRRAGVVSVLGELLLTAGAVVLLFVVWQMWVGDVIMQEEGNRDSERIAAEWQTLPPPPPPEAIVEDDGTVVFEPVIAARPVGTADFGVMYVPRFGADYKAPLAGGTTRAGTLDRNRVGLYADAAMPGEVGNFSIAAHRRTYGGYFRHIDSLQLGDAIIIELQEGWYLYRFRSMEYVTPDRVQVLLEVPQVPGAQTGERYITLTTCSPLYSLAERLIGYGVFESFQPRAEGPPVWFQERNS